MTSSSNPTGIISRRQQATGVGGATDGHHRSSSSSSSPEGSAAAIRSDHHHAGVPGLARSTNNKKHHHRRRRCSRTVAVVTIICSFWFVVLSKLYYNISVTNSNTSADAASTQNSDTGDGAAVVRGTIAGGGDSAEINNNNINENSKKQQQQQQQQDGGRVNKTPPRIDDSKNAIVDGTFNTLPLKLVSNSGDNKLRSFVECVRHNNHNQHHHHNHNNNINSWMYTSCQFTNLCMDINTHEYVVVTDDDDIDLQQQQQQQHNQFSSGSVAIGGINPRWDMSKGFNMGSSKVRWFPKIIRQKSSSSSSQQIIKFYYQLPDDIIWIPFHSMGGHNVGHMLWDDFYPIYRLAEIFGYTAGTTTSTTTHKDTDDTRDTGSSNNDGNQKYRWLLTRYVVNGTLYASCDIRRNKRIQCTNNFAKFLDLLGSDPFTFTSNRRIRFEANNNNNNNDAATAAANLVCARTGLAGIGMLTDHGLRDHGWELKQSWVPHNYMHGHTFYNFRQFIINNIKSKYKLRIPPTAASDGTASSSLVVGGNTDNSLLHHDEQRLRITFSILSSRDYDRRLDFNNHIRALQQALADVKEIIIGSHALWNMTVPEQLQLALDTHIWIQACGGASMTSTFLNRGTSLILFYNETGGLNFNEMQSNGMPARLDWDLLDNSHLHLHWFAIGSMNTQSQLEVFVKLIKHELSLIRNTR